MHDLDKKCSETAVNGPTSVIDVDSSKKGIDQRAVVLTPTDIVVSLPMVG